MPIFSYLSILSQIQDITKISTVRCSIRVNDTFSIIIQNKVRHGTKTVMFKRPFTFLNHGIGFFIKIIQFNFTLKRRNSSTSKFFIRHIFNVYKITSRVKNRFGIEFPFSQSKFHRQLINRFLRWINNTQTFTTCLFTVGFPCKESTHMWNMRTP